MVTVVNADITNLKNVEAIVNAANGVGPMGHGVAGAIGQAGGPELRNDVRRLCEKAGGYEPGSCYISVPGNLGKKGILAVYHAVTMKYPGSPTSTAIVQEAMRTTIKAAIQNGIKSIAFPGLGIGIGALPKQIVARDMADIAKAYADSIDITIADLDDEFISYVQKRLQTENAT